MYRTWQRLSLAALAAALIVTAAASWLAAPAPARAAKTVRINAQNSGFSVKEIQVDPGEELDVILTNMDLFNHGILFELDGDRVEKIDPIGIAGERRLSFTAPTTDGRYPYFSQEGRDRENGFAGVLLVGDAASSQEQRTIAVDGVNYRFTPNQILVDPGETITIEFTSSEGFHDIVFELEGERVEASERVRAPEMTSFSFTVPTEPGAYTFFCSVGTHRDQGMVGTLIVGDPIPVKASNFTFDPDRLEVRPGETVVLELQVEGGTHDIVFELEGGVEARTSRIGAGETEILIFTAPETPGEYAFYCSVGRHREFGMEGVLVVGDGGGGSSPTPPPPGETPTPTDVPPPTDTPTAMPTDTPGPARFEVMMDGLNSPHGLWLDEEGEELLVSEGGTGNPVPGQFTPGNGDGRVQSIDMGTPWTSAGILIADMTNSLDPGGGVVGANHALRHGGGFGTSGDGGVLVAQAGGPGHLRPDEAAKILLVSDEGESVLVADPLAYEVANNPGGESGDEGLDSNPWRLIDGPGGLVYVVDAGANDILTLDPDTGELATWAVFAPLTADGGQQAIPTGLAFADDGTAYVTLLGRFAPPDGTEGSAQVRKLMDLNDDGDMLDAGENVLHAPELWLATDIAISPSGALYAISIGGPGTVLHIPMGAGPVEAEAVVTGVPAISTMAFLPNGDLLVSETSNPAPAPAPNLRPDRIVRIPVSALTPTERPPIYMPFARKP